MITRINEKILEACSGLGATKSAIAKATGVKQSNIHNYINKLREAGLIEMMDMGTNRAAIYVVHTSLNPIYMVDNVVRASHNLRHMAHDPFGKTRRHSEAHG